MALFRQMFGWFRGSSTCPVPEETRAWVISRIEWIFKEFGKDWVLQCPMVLPTREYFPHPYHGAVEDVEQIFATVCGYLRIPVQDTELYIVEGRVDEATNHMIASAGGSALGTYLPEQETGRSIICISVDLLDRPTDLVATMAHELCHVHLLGSHRLRGDEDDHEPLTDLLCACLGFGVFGANGTVTEMLTPGDFGNSWSVSSAGYLSQPAWAYALASLARLRDDEQALWTRHLRPDIKALYKKSLRFLQAQDQE